MIYERSNMIDSNERKLSLSDWLKKNHYTSYKSPLKLQTFLLLYEAFSKAAGEEPDFNETDLKSLNRFIN